MCTSLNKHPSYPPAKVCNVPQLPVQPNTEHPVLSESPHKQVDVPPPSLSILHQSSLAERNLTNSVKLNMSDCSGIHLPFPILYLAYANFYFLFIVFLINILVLKCCQCCLFPCMYLFSLVPRFSPHCLINLSSGSLSRSKGR